MITDNRLRFRIAEAERTMLRLRSPLPSYKDSGADAWSGQGRAFFARSSESRSCGTETLDGEDGRIR